MLRFPNLDILYVKCCLKTGNNRQRRIRGEGGLRAPLPPVSARGGGCSLGKPSMKLTRAFEELQEKNLVFAQPCLWLSLTYWWQFSVKTNCSHIVRQMYVMGIGKELALFNIVENTKDIHTLDLATALMGVLSLSSRASKLCVSSSFMSSLSPSPIRSCSSA